MLQKFKSAGKTLKREVKVYLLVLQDKRTPKFTKFLLSLAVGYAFVPFDLIPDFIPVVGHLDDLIIIPTLIILAHKMIPEEVIQECRTRVANSPKGGALAA